MDFALSNYILGLKSKHFFLPTTLNSLFKGALFEQIVGQHLLFSGPPYQTPELYMWAREKAQSSAEVDYLIQVDGTIVPIEIKSGAMGQMKSMHIFLKERKLKLGLRFNIDPPSIFDTKESRICSLPAYLVTEAHRICLKI